MNTAQLTQLARLVLPTLLAMLDSSAASHAHPVFIAEAPQSTHSEIVADALHLNGKPLQITRTLSKARLPALLHHYRHQFGRELAEARVGHTTILSSERNGQFITIVLKPLGTDKHEILTATTALHPSARPAQPGTLAGNLRLPAGSVLLSALETRDPGRHTTQLVLSNTHSLAVNLARFRTQLAAHGLQPEGDHQHQPGQQVWLQHFSGAGGEARLLLMRSAQHTEAILTMIRSTP